MVVRKLEVTDVFLHPSIPCPMVGRRLCGFVKGSLPNLPIIARPGTR